MSASELKKNIYTIEELIDELKSLDPRSYGDVLRKLAIDANSVDAYARWEKDCYSRISLFKNESFELLLLCWDSGQETAIHSHNNQECWVYMVDGKLEEENFIYDPELQDLVAIDLRNNERRFSYMNDNMGYHKLMNKSSHRAMSLHLYAKPIESCKIWDEEIEKFKTIELKCHSYSG